MKLRALSVGLLFLLVITTRVSAQTITYDSIPIDTTFYVADFAQADSIQGEPDHFQAHMGGSDAFPVQFWVQHLQPATMDSGATLNVYWSRVSSDSCAMNISFQYYDFSNIQTPPTLGPTIQIIQDGPENVWNMTAIKVPNSGYNTLYIAVGANGNAGEPGADSCFLDAIVLVQKGSVSTSTIARRIGSQPTVLMNYPNPFYHSTGTRVRVNAPTAGIGMLSITDALGREVRNVPLGELNSGDAEANLSLDRAGVFFVRLYIDGAPVGSPLEISGE